MFKIFVPFGADSEGHNWKHDLARLCFMVNTPISGNSREMIEIIGVH